MRIKDLIKTFTKTTLILISCLFVCSCATQYKPLDKSGGYYHKKLTEKKYIVGFIGQGFTKVKTAKDYALLRSAQIGKKLLFSYLTVESSDLEISKNKSMNNYKNCSGFCNAIESGLAGQTPKIELTIKYHDEKPKERSLDLYNIEDIINNARKN